MKKNNKERKKKKERKKINESKIEKSKRKIEKKNKLFGTNHVWTMYKVVVSSKMCHENINR